MDEADEHSAQTPEDDPTPELLLLLLFDELLSQMWHGIGMDMMGPTWMAGVVWVWSVGQVGECWEGNGGEGSVPNGLIMSDGGTFRIDDGTP